MLKVFPKYQVTTIETKLKKLSKQKEDEHKILIFFLFELI